MVPKRSLGTQENQPHFLLRNDFWTERLISVIDTVHGDSTRHLTLSVLICGGEGEM